MSVALKIILSTLSVVFLLVSVGGLKDWKEAGSWDRFRIIVPGVVAIVIGLIVLNSIFSDEVLEDDAARQMSVHSGRRD